MTWGCYLLSFGCWIAFAWIGFALNAGFADWGVGILAFVGCCFWFVVGFGCCLDFGLGFMSFNCYCLFIDDWNCFGMLSVYTSFEFVVVE